MMMTIRENPVRLVLFAMPMVIVFPTQLFGMTVTIVLIAPLDLLALVVIVSTTIVCVPHMMVQVPGVTVTGNTTTMIGKSSMESVVTSVRLVPPKTLAGKLAKSAVITCGVIVAKRLLVVRAVSQRIANAAP